MVSTLGFSELTCAEKTSVIYRIQVEVRVLFIDSLADGIDPPSRITEKKRFQINSVLQFPYVEKGPSRKVRWLIVVLDQHSPARLCRLCWQRLRTTTISYCSKPTPGSRAPFASVKSSCSSSKIISAADLCEGGIFSPPCSKVLSLPRVSGRADPIVCGRASRCLSGTYWMFKAPDLGQNTR